MIIHSPKEQPFCLRVQYSHDTDVIMRTKETDSICHIYAEFMEEFKSSFRVKKSASATRIGRRDADYNKYYINPEQRYLRKSEDPKKNVANLKDEHYIYNNLHNQQFHNWKHPFDKQKTLQTTHHPSLSQKNIKELIKFKTHMERNKKGRLPALVSELI